MRRFTVAASRGVRSPVTIRPTYHSFAIQRLSTHVALPIRSNFSTTKRSLCNSTAQADVNVRMPDMSKDQQVLDFEANIVKQLDTFTPHSISGNELIALIQDLPVMVSHMESPIDPIACDIISRTALLLKEYPRNFEVHLNATLDAITELNCSLPQVRELVAAIAKKVSKLNRSFTDAESWAAVNSLRNFTSEHPETLALVKAISKKIPVENTKIEFTPVDTVLISLRGLNGMNSDCEEVLELLRAINFRLRHKKGKIKFFSSFQDAVLGVHNKSSSCPEVREFLAILVDMKYRWDAFLPPVLATTDEEEEADEVVKQKRHPSRFRLERLNFEDGQEVVDFIRVLGKKPHRFSQFHSLYKKSDRDRESPYLEVISFLDLPVHTPLFSKENADFITAHHEAGHIVASHLLKNSPAEAVGAKIRRLASYTTFRPREVSAMANTEEGFIDKQAIAMAGLAAEYLIMGAISASAGNHDFRSVIDAAKEQITSDGTFVPKEGTSMQFFANNLKSMLWVISGSLDRGGEKDWVEEHVLHLIEHQFFRVLELLSENEDILRELAEILMTNRSLSEEEIRRTIFSSK